MLYYVILYYNIILYYITYYITYYIALHYIPCHAMPCHAIHAGVYVYIRGILSSNLQLKPLSFLATRDPWG